MGKSVNPLDAVGSIFGGIGSIASAGISSAAQSQTNKMNLQMMREQNQFNHDEAALQFDREKEMFNLENQYNNPVEVVQRLRAAGINPSVALSGSLGSAMSSAASGGQPVAASAGAMPANIQSPFANFASGVLDSSFKVAQILKTLADAKKTGIDTDFLTKTLKSRVNMILQDENYKEVFTDLYTRFEPQRISLELAKTSKEIRKLDEEVYVLIKDGKLKEAQSRLHQLQGDKQVFENNYLSAYYKEMESNVQRIVKADVENKEQDVELKKKQGIAIVKQAEAALIGANASMLSAQAQDYLAHNPNDLSAVLAKVIEGYTGNPSDFGHELKEKGIVSVFTKMSSDEVDRFCGDIAEKFGIAKSTFKRGFQLSNPIFSTIELLSDHSDAQNAVLDWQRKYGGSRTHRK